MAAGDHWPILFKNETGIGWPLAQEASRSLASLALLPSHFVLRVEKKTRKKKTKASINLSTSISMDTRDVSIVNYLSRRYRERSLSSKKER